MFSVRLFCFSFLGICLWSDLVVCGPSGGGDTSEDDGRRLCHPPCHDNEECNKNLDGDPECFPTMPQCVCVHGDCIVDDQNEHLCMCDDGWSGDNCDMREMEGSSNEGCFPPCLLPRRCLITNGEAKCVGRGGRLVGTTPIICNPACQSGEECVNNNGDPECFPTMPQCVCVHGDCIVDDQNQTSCMCDDGWSGDKCDMREIEGSSNEGCFPPCLLPRRCLVTNGEAKCIGRGRLVGTTSFVCNPACQSG
uniref:EGF-like domain-containing protein n=1 Tax=Ciona savignyi TaxID=51511 RepID=H2ZQX9_CIOSA